MSNGISHFHLFRGLDTRYNVTYIARTKFVTWNQFHFQYTYFIGIILFSGIKELHFISLADYSIFDLKVSDNATEGVEYRVKNQCLQRSFLITFGMRNAFDNGCEDFLHAHSGLTGCTYNLITLAAQQFYDFVLYLFGHGTCHITFIDNGDNFEIMFDSHIQIGDGLCLHSLRCVYDKQRTFASGNGTGYLIRKIHVPRSVNQVKDILFTFVVVLHLDSVALDGDTSLLLQIHIIKHLPVSHLNSVGKLQQAVCQG